MRIDHRIFRMDPITHAWILDDLGWQFELFGVWIAKFSPSFVQDYGSTWAIAFGRGETYYYRPAEKHDVN